VLGKGRRLRFANTAWEKLTGLKLADAVGMVCSSRRHSSPLAAALAPTPEAQAGRTDLARRPAPHGRGGPPWWDVSFIPLAGAEGPLGIAGFISVVGESQPAVLRKLPPGLGGLREQHARAFTFDLFAGDSPASTHFLGQLRHASGSMAPVWLTGERGSGKETAARVIHHNGPQRDRAFFGLACSGLQPYLIESLLFGHGGLTGSNHLGTVYLKGPAALPRDMQSRLAEYFGEAAAGTPRLICGSVRPAADEVAEGKLVPDFHTDLSVLQLRVPPLRERLAELPRIAAHLFPLARFEPEVFEVLGVQPWPGNIREFRDVLAPAIEAAGSGPILREHMPYDMRSKAGAAPPPVVPKPLTLDPLLEAVERRLVALAVERCQGNVSRAAELLGIQRNRLIRRMEALGLNRPAEDMK
jgi:DNA-binding NtrC family response regulator